MTSLAPNADLAVRHAVDAYIDGRLLPTFEGEAFFETRNSRYRLVDGVLFAAPESGLIGAELVGWLIDYVARSEVVTQWRAGARAVLVDTRNDGVRGPQIVVTSATRAFQSERDARQSSPRDSRQSSPRMPAPVVAAPPPFVPGHAGSRMPQSGSTLPPPPADLRQSLPRDVRQSVPRDVRQSVPRDVPQSVPRDVPQSPARPQVAAWQSLPPPAPVPTFRPATIPPPAMVPARVATWTAPPPAPRPLPRALPPQPPAFADEVAARKVAAAIEASWSSHFPNEETEDLAPTVRNEGPRSNSRLAHGRGVSQRLPPPPASVPFMLSRTASRSHQRGMPLR
jgi:hypothetical protein